MEEKLNSYADDLTNDLMSKIFGKKFDDCVDISEDEEMNRAWEYMNERIFGCLWAAYDDGFYDGENFATNGK